MNKLEKFQKTFVENVIYHANNPSNDLLENMIPIGKLNPKEVIGVYSNDYRFRMLEAMQSNFEAIWMVLGDEKFEELVFEFIKVYPSLEYDLNLYGKSFPDFLNTQSELIKDLPFLVELAQFEINFWNVFNQKNELILDRLKFTNEFILSSRLHFDDSLVLWESGFHVFPLFQFKDKTLEEFFENHEASLINNPACYLMFKEGSKVICQTLTKAQFLFFSELKKNKSLFDVINEAPDITEEETVDIFKLISTSLLHKLKEG
jgi:hypothetical protein